MIFCGNQTRSGLLGEMFGKLPREDPFSPTNPGVQDSIFHPGQFLCTKGSVSWKTYLIGMTSISPSHENTVSVRCFLHQKIQIVAVKVILDIHA